MKLVLQSISILSLALLGVTGLLAMGSNNPQNAELYVIAFMTSTVVGMVSSLAWGIYESGEMSGKKGKDDEQAK